MMFRVVFWDKLQYIPEDSSEQNLYSSKWVSCKVEAILDIHRKFYFIIIVLSGVVISALATGPKIRGSKSADGDGLLRAINIRSSPFFKGK
jgi:hypothetical protein